MLAVDPAVPPPPPPPPERVRVTVKALFDFPGVENGDLPFRDGDVIEADKEEFEANQDGGWVTHLLPLSSRRILTCFPFQGHGLA